MDNGLSGNKAQAKMFTQFGKASLIYIDSISHL